MASVPPELAGVGSGANNTARYLGAALGITLVAVLAARTDPAAMLAGWTTAALVTAGISALGAVAVLSVSRTPRPAPLAAARS
jgi:sugar phosphate permease